jgi:hypothetical protein
MKAFSSMVTISLFFLCLWTCKVLSVVMPVLDRVQGGSAGIQRPLKGLDFGLYRDDGEVDLVFHGRSFHRHAGGGRRPGSFDNAGLGGFPAGGFAPVFFWIPACAGMTGRWIWFFMGVPSTVTPAEAGVQDRLILPAWVVFQPVVFRRFSSGFRPAPE